jgi:hypothetical protein
MWNNLWVRIKPYVTLQMFVNFIVQELRMLYSFIAKICGDMFTNWNGDVDPARLIGYLIVIIFAVLFIWLTILDTFWHHSFNSMAFSTGAGVIAVQLLAAAGGVRIKQSSEIPLPPMGEMMNAANTVHKKSVLRRIVKDAIKDTTNA